MILGGERYGVEQDPIYKRIPGQFSEFGTDASYFRRVRIERILNEGKAYAMPSVASTSEQILESSRGFSQEEKDRNVSVETLRELCLLRLTDSRKFDSEVSAEMAKIVFGYVQYVDRSWANGETVSEINPMQRYIDELTQLREEQ